MRTKFREIIPLPVSLKSIPRLLLALLAMALVGLATPLRTQAGTPVLEEFFTFDDDIDPTTTAGKVFGTVGEITGGVVYTADAEGRTSAAGDKGMNIGNSGFVRIADVGFFNVGAAQDQITVSFWQKLATVKNSSAFD